jgi:hypothetical protein
MPAVYRAPNPDGYRKKAERGDPMDIGLLGIEIALLRTGFSD